MESRTHKLNVCLMFGGRSTEHDISIISGLQVYNALNKDKYNVTILYITKENKMLIGKKLKDIETYQKENFERCTKEVLITNINNETYLKTKRKKLKVDVFIPVFHGEGAEDGTISSLLDFFNGVYITSNSLASAISQDKAYTKDILKKYYISSPRYLSINNLNDIEVIIKTINEKLFYPLIIKPSRLGSSIGIKTVTQKEKLRDSLKEVFKYSNTLIVEELIKNKKEFNCACFKYNNHLYVSNIEEVLTTNEILTFEDKYLNDIKDTENKQRVIPAKIDTSLEENIKELTKKIYQILNHQGIIRIDYLYDTNKNKLYFNEINTIPGSFAFYLFDKDKLPFDHILDMLIKEAILNKQRNNKLIKVFNTNVLNKKKKILKK